MQSIHEIFTNPSYILIGDMSESSEGKAASRGVVTGRSQVRNKVDALVPFGKA